MTFVRALMLVLLALVPFQAIAAEGELQPFEDTTSKQVRMPILVAPVVARGKLQGYLYLQVVIETPDRGQAEKLALKIPYLQDAFVREVHRETIVRNDDPKAIDGHALKERLRARIEAIVGAGIAKDIFFENANEAALKAVNGPGELLQPKEEKPKEANGH
jgi:hypothetical protein